jgi:hypothetical protein
LVRLPGKSVLDDHQVGPAPDLFEEYDYQLRCFW